MDVVVRGLSRDRRERENINKLTDAMKQAEEKSLRWCEYERINYVTSVDRLLCLPTFDNKR